MKRQEEKVQHSRAYRRIMARRRRMAQIKRRVVIAAIIAGVLAGVCARCVTSMADMPVEAEDIAMPVLLETMAVLEMEGDMENNRDTDLALDGYDQELLKRLAMAEAEGEDTEGKALVMLTVLNRMANEGFPDSIEEVIYQDGAFTPVANGRFRKVSPDADCEAALALVKSGWDGSRGALYFERTTSASTWHSRSLKKLFTHGSHTFYTEVGRK